MESESSAYRGFRMSEERTTPGAKDRSRPSADRYRYARTTYRPLAPRRFNAVADILDPWALESPDAIALMSIDATGDRADSMTTGQLAAQSRAMAVALRSLGVLKGDRVFIMLPRVSAWYIAMLGVMRIGAVAMPGPNLLTAKDIAYRVAQGSPVAVITDIPGAAKVDAAISAGGSVATRICWSGSPEPVKGGWVDFDALLRGNVGLACPNADTTSDDPLLIYFTSGTVSHPKIVEHRQSYGLAHVATARFWHDLKSGDRHWTVSDTGWAKAAWGGLFGQWHEGATVVQAMLGKPDSDLILRIIAKHAITSFCAPPTLYRQLIQADFSPHDLTALRHCTSAGEPLNPEVIRVWQEKAGVQIYDGYGQTESTVLVANFPGLDIRPGSMGKPVPGYEVDIVDEDGNRASDGEAGAIAVRTDPHPIGLFHGYFGDPLATAERFRHGWYYTGDRGTRDPDGYLWFQGRDDDVITSSAYRIGPFEVESALLEHPAVTEAGVVGRPDPDRTEIVCAFVVLAPGFSASDSLTLELQTHVKQVTAPYKYPREIRYVTELPKTISGKIRRAVLRQGLQTEPDP
jgi:acetyl-CoA synthetase